MMLDVQNTPKSELVVAEPASEPVRLASEEVILSSPMSFIGSAKRIWRLTRRSAEPVPHGLLCVLAVTLIAVAWTVILAWYVLMLTLFLPFFLLWRFFRHSSRRGKRTDLQHREMVAAIAAQRESAKL